MTRDTPTPTATSHVLRPLGRPGAPPDDDTYTPSPTRRSHSTLLRGVASSGLLTILVFAYVIRGTDASPASCFNPPHGNSQTTWELIAYFATGTSAWFITDITRARQLGHYLLGKIVHMATLGRHPDSSDDSPHDFACRLEGPIGALIRACMCHPNSTTWLANISEAHAHLDGACDDIHSKLIQSCQRKNLSRSHDHSTANLSSYVGYLIANPSAGYYPRCTNLLDTPRVDAAWWDQFMAYPAGAIGTMPHDSYTFTPDQLDTFLLACYGRGIFSTVNTSHIGLDMELDKILLQVTGYQASYTYPPSRPVLATVVEGPVVSLHYDTPPSPSAPFARQSVTRRDSAPSSTATTTATATATTANAVTGTTTAKPRLTPRPYDDEVRRRRFPLRHARNTWDLNYVSTSDSGSEDSDAPDPTVVSPSHGTRTSDLFTDSRARAQAIADANTDPSSAPSTTNYTRSLRVPTDGYKSDDSLNVIERKRIARRYGTVSEAVTATVAALTHGTRPPPSVERSIPLADAAIAAAAVVSAAAALRHTPPSPEVTPEEVGSDAPTFTDYVAAIVANRGPLAPAAPSEDAMSAAPASVPLDASTAPLATPVDPTTLRPRLTRHMAPAPVQHERLQFVSGFSMSYQGSSSSIRPWAYDLAQSYLLFGSSKAKPASLINDRLSTDPMAKHGSDGSSEWRGNQPYDFPLESRVHVRRTPAETCPYDDATRSPKRRRRFAD